jgi:hypothetical protein
LQNLVVTLPVNVPAIGTVVLRYTATQFDSDDFDINTITVAQQIVPADIDGDGIPNALDIDSDGDRIWDKYESTDDVDGDGVPNYRDTDSNNDGILDGIEASLTSADIAALVAGGSTPAPFILLSDAGLTLDFTQIANTAFSDVEYIDMRDGVNAQTITLTLQDVIAMTNSDNELVIVGDGQDTVNATGFELTTLQKSIQGQVFNIYTALDDTKLFIHEDVNVVLT